MEDILIPIGFFAAVFGIVYIVTWARHKEKMSMIEKGADPALFSRKGRLTSYNTFKYGLFFIGIAIGIVLADLLTNATQLDEVGAYFSMILLFGGLALVVAYLLRNKLQKSDE
ncbi:MAG: hypothetical protein K9H26_16870 [Prolixibacteraceae bacterium]|nr:hypothetical protein [Prolixibacteraceae bacterium]